MDQLKVADATLAEYALYQVADNWLEERLIEQMKSLPADLLEEQDEELDLAEETRRLEEQLSALPDGYGEGRGLFVDDLEGEDDVWDDWSRKQEMKENKDWDRAGVMKVKEPPPGM